MMRKFVWLMVSILMVLSLLIMSCDTTEDTGGTVTTEDKGQTVTVGEEEKEEEEETSDLVQEGPEMVELSLTKLDGTKVTKKLEEPQYGGTIMSTIMLPPKQFDPFLFHQFFMGTRYFTNEALFYGDWARGPAGTGETDWMDGFAGRFELLEGALVEGWDIPDGHTIVWHVRPGVHWWDKPPTNGRELVADDIAWTMNRMFESPNSFFAGYKVAGINPTSINVLDKYTVEVIFPETVSIGVVLTETGGNMPMCPPDVTELYGDMSDWRNACGTGPWILVDHVPDSTVTYLRNPNYWMNDPLFPDNQLPYADKMITFEIPDASTTLAAFRTAKIWEIGASWEDWKLLNEQIPELDYTINRASFLFMLSGRVDKPELPFHDLKVRRALNMAVNQQELVDDYYEGNAELLAYPIKPTPTFMPWYTPLEEQPESVQELFSYNPEKAKKLLAEAGYPDGFKTKVTTTSAGADTLAIIREYFLLVGVDMEIEVVEGSVFNGLWSGHKHDEMIYHQTDPTNSWTYLCERETHSWNSSRWHDPKVDEAYQTVCDNIWREDPSEAYRTIKETASYILDNAWGVWMPLVHRYNMWWPWVKNYYGVFNLGYNAQGAHRKFVWIDTDLMKSMGY